MATLSQYIKLLRSEKRKFPQCKIWALLPYYRRWKQSFSDHDGLHQVPWMTFGVIDYLEDFARSDMRVFEYGSGSSTLFWAKRVAEVVSVEHDKEWAGNVTGELAKRGLPNAKLSLVLPTPRANGERSEVADPHAFASDDDTFRHYSFEEYVRTIEKYPDNYFDVVVVDGRSRPSCIVAGIPKVKKGGILVVDNSERDYYFQQTLKFLPREEWNRKDFCGPVPGLRHFHQTTVFKRSS